MPDTAAPRCFALLPCAGQGTRAGVGQPKQYALVAGRPVVHHTLAALAQVPRITAILAVVAPQDTAAPLQALADQPEARCLLARCGGATRAESVFNGLRHLLATVARPQDWVLVHDAARCLILPRQIDALMDACLPDDVGGLLALPLPDTLKAADAGGQRVSATLTREAKWLAQTPQMFRLGLLYQAYSAQAARGFAGMTDEASAIEAAGYAPLLVRGSAQNFKLTYPEDFALAEAVLAARQA